MLCLKMNKATELAFLNWHNFESALFILLNQLYILLHSIIQPLIMQLYVVSWMKMIIRVIIIMNIINKRNFLSDLYDIYSFELLCYYLYCNILEEEFIYQEGNSVSNQLSPTNRVNFLFSYYFSHSSFLWFFLFHLNYSYSYSLDHIHCHKQPTQNQVAYWAPVLFVHSIHFFLNFFLLFLAFLFFCSLITQICIHLYILHNKLNYSVLILINHRIVTTISIHAQLRIYLMLKRLKECGTILIIIVFTNFIIIIINLG